MERDTAGTQAYYDEIMIFARALPRRLELRKAQKEQETKNRERMEEERRQRKVSRAASLFGK